MEDAERERSHSLRKLTIDGQSERPRRHASIVLPASPVARDDEEEEDEERRAGVESPASPASTITAYSDDDEPSPLRVAGIPGGQQTLRDPADTQPLMLSQREAEEVVARKKRVILHDIVKLGDVFWLYLAFNCESLFFISVMNFFSCFRGSFDLCERVSDPSASNPGELGLVSQARLGEASEGCVRSPPNLT